MPAQHDSRLGRSIFRMWVEKLVYFWQTPRQRRLLWRLLLGILVTIGCVVLLAPVISVESLLSSVANANHLYLTLAFVIVISGQVFRALRLGMIVQARGSFSLTIYRISALHFFWASLLPAKTGELSLVLMLRNNYASPTLNGIGILLGIRLLDFLLVSSMLGIGAWYVVQGDGPLGFVRFPAIAGGISALAAFLILPHLSRNLLLRLQKAEAASKHPMGRLLLQVMSSYLALPRTRITSIQVVTVIVWLSVIVGCYLIVRALDDHAGIVASLFATAAGSMTFALPISGFAQLGPFEASWTYAGILAGMTENLALASALLVHFISLSASALQALLLTLLAPAQDG